MQDSRFIGLDVHKATISVAVAQGKRGGEVRHWGSVPHRPDHIRKLVEKLAAGGARLHFCYALLHGRLRITYIPQPTGIVHVLATVDVKQAH